MNGLIEGNGKQILEDGTVITGNFKHGKVQKTAATPDYHEKYVGTVFPVKLPSVDSLDVVRKKLNKLPRRAILSASIRVFRAFRIMICLYLYFQFNSIKLLGE